MSPTHKPQAWRKCWTDLQDWSPNQSIQTCMEEGPIPAGEQNDVTIFRTGLKKRIPIGKKIIINSGYNGEQYIISTENDLDPREIDSFVDCVLS
eukprot:7605544-Ditylum_brightwellii.AAC.1